MAGMTGIGKDSVTPAIIEYLIVPEYFGRERMLARETLVQVFLIVRVRQYAREYAGSKGIYRR